MEARRRYVVITTRVRDDIPPDVLAAHRERLRALLAEGRVVASGGFAEGGGLIVYAAADLAEVEALAREDPFVVHGTHTYVIRTWLQDLGSL